MARRRRYPIKHWSHSSLVSYLRNPLAWYKRYVEEIYDTPGTPSSLVGRAGHTALQHFYSGAEKDVAIRLGLEYLRSVPDFELEFGRATTKKARRAKRAAMERDYLQAIGFYLARPPRHKVIGVEVRGVVEVEDLPLPLKAISDLVVASPMQKGAVDVVDHKFVESFTKRGSWKSLYTLQAIFNYYVARELFGKPVARFIVYECKKSKNVRGGPQLRKHVIEYDAIAEDFAVFHRLIRDASEEIARRRVYLPNPSDMFEGEDAFNIYRLGLVDERE